MEKVEKIKGYSIWLMPEGETRKKLMKLISQLANKYGGPVFEPHVTLIGEVAGKKEEILRKSSRLAKMFHPFKIKLGSVGYSGRYFRCLFIEAEKTPELLKASKKAREVFDRSRDPEYMPHLSLLYGKLAQKTKEEIKRKIGRKFDMTFEARSLHVFSTKGEPKNWKKVKQFLLK